MAPHLLLRRDSRRRSAAKQVPYISLHSFLKAYYPVALQLFTKRKPRSSLIFLQTYPTLQAALSASVQEIEATLRKGDRPIRGRQRLRSSRPCINPSDR